MQVAQLSAGGSDVDCFADQMQTVFRDALGMGAQKSVGIRGASLRYVKWLNGLGLLPNGEQEI